VRRDKASGPATTPTRSRRPVPSRKVKPSLPHGADAGPSLAELAELTGATPGEVLAALWDLRTAERERR
jgi:hypothetical protein